MKTKNPTKEPEDSNKNPQQKKDNNISFEDWKTKKGHGSLADIFKKKLKKKEYSEKELDKEFEKFMNKKM